MVKRLGFAVLVGIYNQTEIKKINMKDVTKIEYENIRKSNVDATKIYAFRNNNGILFLCKIENKFYWKPLSSVGVVCKDDFNTIEDAIENILKFPTISCGGSRSVLMEFDTLSEFVIWCFSELGYFEVYKQRVLDETESNIQKFLELRGIMLSEYKAFVSTGVDLKKPHIIVVSKVPSGFWYSDMNGRTFNVKYATSKGEMRETEGFGGYDLSEILIVTDGEFKGNALLKSHCLCYGFGK
jgi:hypothetical protein